MKNKIFAILVAVALTVSIGISKPIKEVHASLSDLAGLIAVNNATSPYRWGGYYGMPYGGYLAAPYGGYTAMPYGGYYSAPAYGGYTAIPYSGYSAVSSYGGYYNPGANVSVGGCN